MLGRHILMSMLALCLAWTCPGWIQTVAAQRVQGTRTYLGYPESVYAESNPFAGRPVAYQTEVPPQPLPMGAVPVSPSPAPQSTASPSDRVTTPTVSPEHYPEHYPAHSQALAYESMDSPYAPYPSLPTYCQQFFLRGWVDQGFTANFDSPADRFNTPQGFNDRSNEYQMNQLYLSMGRAVRQDCCWDFGGRVDLLYGTDYRFTQALGLETHRTSLMDNRWNGSQGPFPSNQALYGLAMPQLYAEIYAPVGQGVSIKMGHFYSILGYESVMAPQNFFYSHSYSMLYGEPFTHTGMLTSWKLGRQVTAHAGFTRGWDTWEPYVGNDTLSFLGGVQWTSRDQRSSLGFALTSGDEPILPAGFGGGIAGFRNATAYSLVFAHQLTPRLQYVFQHDLGVHNDAAFNSVEHTRLDAAWYSVNQYLFYQLTDTLTLGLRGEWFRDDKNSRVLKFPSATDVAGSDYAELTLGLQWKPIDCLTVRSEARWDWSNVEGVGFPPFGGMFHDKEKKEQFTLAVGAVVVF